MNDLPGTTSGCNPAEVTEVDVTALVECLCIHGGRVAALRCLDETQPPEPLVDTERSQ